MNPAYDVRRYDFGCYDKYLCLKPSSAMIVSALFLCRDLVLPVIAGVAAMKAGDSQMMGLAEELHQPYWAITALPSFAVLAALAYRRPGAPRILRWIWRHGRGLLILAVLLQAVVELREMGSEFSLSRSTLPAVLLVFLAAIIIYLVFSHRVRDSFQDFPVAEEMPAPRRRPPLHR